MNTFCRLCELYNSFSFIRLLNAFTKVVNPNYLLLVVEILFLNFITIVIIIYITLYFKKRKFFFTRKVQQEMEVWVTQAILNDFEGERQFAIPKSFFRLLRNNLTKQFVIDELIKIKKNVTGTAANNVIALYESLDLKKYSLRKIRKRKWYEKTRGIHELYSMQQIDTLKKIYKDTNSKNEYVRMEAQVGVINMTGFDGLLFLNIVTYPITEWQQIKLLDQLKSSEDEGQLATNIPSWLESSNDTVVVFSLRLAEVYQQFSVYDSVVKCLRHLNVSVRIQAIKTLVQIANKETPLLLTEHYKGETFTNQIAILDALLKIATFEQSWFLIDLLDDENDLIKLKAARALAVCFSGGMEILEEKAKAPYGPYKKILLHIKYEMGK